MKVEEHQPVGLTRLAVLTGEHVHTLDARLGTVKLIIKGRIPEELREDVVELLLLDEIHHSRNAHAGKLGSGSDRGAALSDIGVRRHVLNVEYLGTERFCYLFVEKVLYEKLLRCRFNFFFNYHTTTKIQMRERLLGVKYAFMTLLF